MGKIIAVCTSSQKGVAKTQVVSAVLQAGQGIIGDAHAGSWHRQVSLLSQESINKMLAKGLKLLPGAFGENLITEGLELFTLPIGTRLKIGKEALVEVTQIGKECHSHCAIYHQVGDCIMPREGIFVRVLKDGEVTAGDVIEEHNFITVGLLIASDQGAAGAREDGCKKVIEELLPQINGYVTEYVILPDERETIAEKLQDWADNKKLDLILTCGGTGFSQRDTTPEATLDIIERQVPGIPEAMRAGGLQITPRAILTRSVAGIRGSSLIINLPGSPKAVQENLGFVLPALTHGIEILKGISINCAR